MGSLTLKIRLALLLGLLLALVAVSGSFAVYHMRGVTASIDTVYRDRIVPMQQLRLVSDAYRVDIAGAVMRMRDGSLSVEETLEFIDETQRRIAKQWNTYKLTYLLDHEKDLIAETESLMGGADAAVARLRALLEKKDIQGTRAFATTEMLDAFAPMGAALNRLFEFQITVTGQESGRSKVAYAMAIWTSMALNILAIAAGGFLAWAVFTRYQAEAGVAEARTERLHRFYVALSRTSQLIVRERNPAVLFGEICKICVDAGHARWATISVVDGDRAVRKASAGPATELYSGFPATESVNAKSAKNSLIVQSLRSGFHRISQDFQNDAEAGLWRDQAIASGTRSAAAFPLRRGGRVVGVLSLHAAEAGFFDEALVALLDEMVADLSFALDTIDAEQAHLDAVQAMREREQQLAAIVESTMEAIITIDAHQHIIVFNHAAVAMFGVPASAAMGGTMDRFIPASVRERHREYVERFSLTGMTSRLMGERRKLTGVRADGREFPIEVSISKTGSAQHPLMTAVIRDLSDLLEAERARQAQADAEAASKAKTEFLSRMSHELRTPLNAILGFSQLLRAEGQNRFTPMEGTQLDHIHKAGWHLLTLINDVLDVSSIESGHLQLDIRGLELRPLLDDAIRMTEPLAQKAGVTLAGVVCAPTLGVWADPIRLRQVLLNLLSNAIKYNRPAGEVRLAAAANDGLACIEVTDTGLGMTREQLKHLYEPFNRLGRERGWIEGTGIGLTLSRQLVDLMQGTMHVDSDSGRGTRVRLSLPIWDRYAAAAPQPEFAAEAAQAPPVGVVLYIEDNPVNMLLVEQMLFRWSGVKFVPAENGARGIELAHSLLPDLVLLDMQLPDMTGFDVLQALRSDSATQSLRIVALSASAMPEEIEHALRYGASDYWTKPLDFDRFLSDVRRLLQRKTAQPVT